MPFRVTLYVICCVKISHEIEWGRVVEELSRGEFSCAEIYSEVRGKYAADYRGDSR